MPLLKIIDLAGAVLSFLSTIAFTREHLSAWPLGLLAATINGYLYLHQGIYADALLELIYFGLIFYGWYLWLYGGSSHKGVSIRHITTIEACSPLFIGLMTSLSLGLLLSHYTHSTIPYIDATTAIFSLLGQWMIGKKIIECWMLWFGVDATYVWLYLNKGIPFHSVLMMVYLCIAVMGYISWYKKMSTKDLSLQTARCTSQ